MEHYAAIDHIDITRMGGAHRRRQMAKMSMFSLLPAPASHPEADMVAFAAELRIDARVKSVKAEHDGEWNSRIRRGVGNLQIPDRFHIAQTDGWLVNHRMNSALPGYLVIGSKTDTNDLSDLSEAALKELGPLLATAQDLLKRKLGAQRVYIGRYGHSPGYPIHFHIIPIYDWVEELFWKDSRYRVLQNFADGRGETPTDGAELTLFVWREFCERAEPPQVEGRSVIETIELLREAMRP